MALAAGLWVNLALASGSGSDGEPDFEETELDAPDAPDEPDEPDVPDEPDEPDEPDVADEPDETDVADGPDELSESSGSGGGDDDNSGSGSGSDDDSSGSSGSSDDDSSNSGPGSSGSGHDSSGSSGSSDNSGSFSNSGSSGRGSDSSEAAGAPSASYEDVALERDESGDERVSGEALFTAAPDEIASAARAGFGIISDTQLAALDRRVARLRVPDGVGVEQAMAILHALAPDAIVAANGVYRSSQSSVSGDGRAAHPGPRAAASGLLGIIDTGVDTASLSAPAAVLSQRAFAAPAPVAREHGTLVAALAVDRGMRVHVADVFRVDAAGRPFASTESIVAALDWLIVANVPVINISIEGPNNALLGALVARAAERGQVVVAAAGNGGPLARPSFPAAFAGSVAVTAIDQSDHPYMRANRGAYIAFAAPGVDLSVRTGEGAILVSGTSFAAPIVSARIAAQMNAPSPANARAVLSVLQRQAVDLGEPGRDPVFGWGAIRD